MSSVLVGMMVVESPSASEISPSASASASKICHVGYLLLKLIVPTANNGFRVLVKVRVLIMLILLMVLILLVWMVLMGKMIEVLVRILILVLHLIIVRVFMNIVILLNLFMVLECLGWRLL